MSLIGRGLSAHASKFPDWEALFSLSSEQLRELGVEPPRTRRYLIQWRQKFRRGEFGVGGDLKHVQDTIQEGMWEMKRGRKIDGGERRRTEVRYKKRIQARREMRERGEIP